MGKERDYSKAENLTKIAEEEILLKIKGGYNIADVMSAYMYNVTKLLAAMAMTHKIIGTPDFDEEDFVNNSMDIMREAIVNHLAKGDKITDMMNGILNN